LALLVRCEYLPGIEYVPAGVCQVLCQVPADTDAGTCKTPMQARSARPPASNHFEPAPVRQPTRRDEARPPDDEDGGGGGLDGGGGGGGGGGGLDNGDGGAGGPPRRHLRARAVPRSEAVDDAGGGGGGSGGDDGGGSGDDDARSGGESVGGGSVNAGRGRGARAGRPPRQAGPMARTRGRHDRRRQQRTELARAAGQTRRQGPAGGPVEHDTGSRGMAVCAPSDSDGATQAIDGGAGGVGVGGGGSRAGGSGIPFQVLKVRLPPSPMPPPSSAAATAAASVGARRGKGRGVRPRRRGDGDDNSGEAGEQQCMECVKIAEGRCRLGRLVASPLPCSFASRPSFSTDATPPTPPTHFRPTSSLLPPRPHSCSHSLLRSLSSRFLTASDSRPAPLSLWRGTLARLPRALPPPRSSRTISHRPGLAPALSLPSLFAFSVARPLPPPPPRPVPPHSSRHPHVGFSPSLPPPPPPPPPKPSLFFPTAPIPLP
jgi:hypothetical protein